MGLLRKHQTCLGKTQPGEFRQRERAFYAKDDSEDLFNTVYKVAKDGK